MGGQGSTRWASYRRRRRTNEVQRVDVRRILRDAKPPRAIVSGDVADHRVILFEVSLEERQLALMAWGEAPQLVALVEVPCTHTGGSRWLGICPSCSRRVAFLFLAGFEDQSFACRRCCKLTYRSQRRRYQPGDAALFRIRRIKRQLGGPEFDIVPGPFPWRPPWMTYARYAHLKYQVEAALDAHAQATAPRLAKLRAHRARLADEAAKMDAEGLLGKRRRT